MAAEDRVVASTAEARRVPIHEVGTIAGNDRVGTGTAIDGVVAVASIDDIAALAAVDVVVAIAAEQRVVARSATDRVVAVATINLIDSRTAADQVVAVTAIQRLGEIDRAVDDVVAVLAIDADARILSQPYRSQQAQINRVRPIAAIHDDRRNVAGLDRRQ